MPGRFDVFFSYSTVDHAAVERVARSLHERGIRVFLDRWYLAAGQPWPQTLERTLTSCSAVAVFIGAEGLGPWQQRERDLALDRQGREPGFPVIPVLLARSDPALGFLRLNTWVDLTDGIADDGALDILAAAIRGEPPGPLARQRTEAILAAVCPYRGLQPFREEDEPFFFGRSTFAETLTAAVSRRSFVAVVGASGSGKSSVVRAGLIPQLRRGAGGLVWDAVTLVPTDRPLTSLAAALLPALQPDPSEVDRLAEVNKLATHLADGTVALRDVAARVLAKQPGTDRLLLFVDQWEELYTLCADEAVRRAFVGHLLEAAAEKVRVVSTIRGDFMGRALDNRDLSDRLQDAVVTIGPMTRDELAETIVKPAEAVGLAFKAGLAETILDDVGEEPGNLPLLEFLLEALWKERRGAVLHYDAYHRLGRVSGAIAHRAEEVFKHGLGEAERQAAKRLLICMVRPGEGVEDTRQRAVMPEADPVAEATIRKLADARLVVTELDAATGRETVEVAHEALIRGWQRLRGWVDQDREFLRTCERIAAQARVWKQEGEPLDRLLAPGRPLAEGEDLFANRRADLEALLMEYIGTSVAAADVGGPGPLLEFVLEALWKDYDAYRRLGRFSGVIAHRAEEVFKQELTPAEQEMAKRLLIRMVRPGEGVEDTRQRAVMPEADPVAEATIRKLADAHLVVTGRETVEVAHEVLIRGWQRLRGWVDQDREFLRACERIAAQAWLWKQEGEPLDRLLAPGRPLAEGEDLFANRRADLEPLLVEYIAASAAAARATEEAATRAAHRRLLLARLIVAAMVLALVAIGGGAIAWWQRGEANCHAEEAQHNAEQRFQIGVLRGHEGSLLAAHGQISWLARVLALSRPSAAASRGRTDKRTSAR